VDADPAQVEGPALGDRGGGLGLRFGLRSGLGLGDRLGLGRFLRGGDFLLALVAAYGGGELLDLGGVLLGGLDPLGLIGADAVDGCGQLAESCEVVGGDGAAACLGVERLDGAVQQVLQLFVVEGSDVLGERDLFHRPGLRMTDSWRPGPHAAPTT
jgi:hypothetical protein